MSDRQERESESWGALRHVTAARELWPDDVTLRPRSLNPPTVLDTAQNSISGFFYLTLRPSFLTLSLLETQHSGPLPHRHFNSGQNQMIPGFYGKGIISEFHP